MGLVSISGSIRYSSLLAFNTGIALNFNTTVASLWGIPCLLGREPAIVYLNLVVLTCGGWLGGMYQRELLSSDTSTVPTGGWVTAVIVGG